MADLLAVTFAMSDVLGPARRRGFVVWRPSHYERDVIFAVMTKRLCHVRRSSGTHGDSELHARRGRHIYLHGSPSKR